MLSHIRNEHPSPRRHRNEHRSFNVSDDSDSDWGVNSDSRFNSPPRSVIDISSDSDQSFNSDFESDSDSSFESESDSEYHTSTRNANPTRTRQSRTHPQRCFLLSSHSPIRPSHSPIHPPQDFYRPHSPMNNAYGFDTSRQNSTYFAHHRSAYPSNSTTRRRDRSPYMRQADPEPEHYQVRRERPRQQEMRRSDRDYQRRRAYDSDFGDEDNDRGGWGYESDDEGRSSPSSPVRGFRAALGRMLPASLTAAFSGAG